VGTSSLVSITSSVDGVQAPLLIVHLKVTVPTVRPVMVELGSEGVVTVPLPDNTDHAPVPTAGVLAESVVEETHMALSLPASAMVGMSLLVMITSSVDGVHDPVVMLHLKVSVPMPIPVTVELGSLALVTVPVPEITDHAPVPEPGLFPERVVEVAQIGWSAPASAVTPLASLVTVTSSKEDGHDPLVIVQRKTFAPTVRPDTELEGLFAFANVPDPLITDQVPVPVTGVFAERLALLAHTD
jgi:hypothetical protein